MPFLLPTGSSLKGHDGYASCMYLASVLSRMSEDQRADHLSAHAQTCQDPRWFFGWEPICAPLRRQYFDLAMTTPAGGRKDFLDGRVTVAFVELPNNEIWAEVETGGADKEAPAAVRSFEELHPGSDLKWFFNATDTRWLGDIEVGRHRPSKD